MADFNIVIRVDPTQARRGIAVVKGGLDEASASADRLRRLIGTAFTFAAIGTGIRSVVQLADAYTNLQNRLRLVTASNAQLAAVTQELFDISNRTRSSFETTANLYSRVALSAKDLGFSQRQLLEFTESLNQAVILSGASTREASAALIQLSQGLASGTLRGDELRSVLEQLPLVADVIAKRLGVTRGELRILGAEGKISAREVVEAFQQAREELAEKFGRTIPTIGQAFEVLRNQFIRLLGDFNSSTSIFSRIAQGVIFLSGHLEELVRVVVALGVAFAINLARQGILVVVSALGKLAIAVATNPLGVMLTALTALTAVVVAFGDQIQLTAGSSATVLDFLAEAFARLAPLVGAVVESVLSALGVLQGSLDKVDFLAIVRSAARAFDRLIAFFFAVSQTAKAIFDDFPRVIGDAVVTGLNFVLRKTGEFVDGIITALNRIPGVAVDTLEGVVPQLENPFSGAGTNVGEVFADSFNAAVKVGLAEGFVNDVAAAAEQRASQRAADDARNRAALEAARLSLDVPGVDRVSGRPDKEFLEILDRTKKEGELLKFNNQEREVQQGLLSAELKLKRDLSTTEEIQLRQALEANQVLADQRAILDDLNGPLEDLQRRRTSLSQLFQDGAISAKQFQEELRRINTELTALDNSVTGGIANGFARLAEEANNVGRSVSDFIVGAFQKASNAIVEFTRTGKLNIREFFADLFAQLAQLALNQAFAQLAQGLIGGGSGGGLFGNFLGGLFGGLPGFANGGGFTVGPNTSIGAMPGVDNRLVAFRARDGERVSVVPRGASEQRDSRASVSNVVNYFITTPDADSFRRSQGQVLARTNASLQRASQRNN